MNMLKTLIPLILVCLLILPYNVHGTMSGPSGSCGENLTWTLQLDGTLIISGTGAMTDFGPSYAENVSVPWAGNRADIKTVVIEEGVTAIGNNAFVACSNLTAVSMPDSITRIGEHAFENCLKLVYANIPSSVTEIGEYAFGGCKALTEVTIPNGVTAIADYSFESCISLKKVHIPESVTSIGRNAFKYCPSLTSIVIPASVISIGRSAFEECENLGHILYAGTQEQWEAVTVRYGAIADQMRITYSYVDGIQYHVFKNDCASQCEYCGYTRQADHTWDDGISAGNTITYTCTVCGETRVDGTTCVPTEPTQPTQPVVPTDPTVPSEPTSPATMPSTPNTSDPTDNGGVTVVIVIVAVVLAAGTAVVLLIVKKKS